jgi:sporulation protein YlmC with PRC-barrel domain
MSRVRLSDTNDWELADSDEDLRGTDLWDAHGHRLGTIDDMVLDTGSQRVVSVILKNGDEYPARDLSVGDGAVYVLNYDAAADPPPATRRRADTQIRSRDADSRRADASGAAAHDSADDRRSYTDLTDSFRSHYDDAYGDRGRDFTDWEPAYRYGYDMAYEADFASRDFDDAEEDLRQGYYRRMGYPMSDRHVWDDVRDAVRRAYEHNR